ncbi:hypothetical protein [Paraburkholderia sp. BL10I2N1]|uniref:hypothetical protein n=1 Tax=Paraburkholderia sp. BL10I2N1 TaxID=1938796 RepID=UPI00105DBA8D|nr:hypothetical protein [Paraburkholderia sp. BL10I2N1]TDN70416.1 hypothetical protein B0G77_3890 [Paraburkholderia sp. BL10I2N1]
MALPRAVQEQADAADAWMAQFSGAGTGAVDPETGEPIAGPEPAQPTPPEAAPQVTPPAAPAAQNPIPEQTWEQKYHTFKGMFDAEVPRLNTAVRELSGQVQQLLAENAQLKTHKAPEPAPQPQPLLTDHDKEAFGPDLVNLIERATKAATAPLQTELERLKGENVQLRSQVGNVSQQQTMTSKDTFMVRLAQRLPDVDRLNVDPGLLTWLKEVDPVYGLPRQAALDNAAQNGDVERTARIFEMYKATLAPPAPNVSNRTTELQRQVTPPRTRASATPQEAQKINWTQQGIEQFYRDLRRGVIPADEAARLEADLYAAIDEGRVRA